MERTMAGSGDPQPVVGGGAVPAWMVQVAARARFFLSKKQWLNNYDVTSGSISCPISSVGRAHDS